jgi:hypothetical protein
MIRLPAEAFAFSQDHHVIAANVGRLHATDAGNAAVKALILRKKAAPQRTIHLCNIYQCSY